MTETPMYRVLIMYSRSIPCPFVTLAKRVLNDHHVPYEELFIDRDAALKADVVAWTGFQSVPTLVVAQPGSRTPCTAFTALAPGASPRGIDRGPMITEPNSAELLAFLQRHGFVSADALE